MEKLQVGKVYVSGKLSREIVRIKYDTIYYRTQTGRSGVCGITTFQDWIKQGQKVNETVTCTYEVSYTINEKEYITTDNISTIELATESAKRIKDKSDVRDIKIIEFKTFRKIININCN